MATDPRRIINKQVRVILPDGLPRGLDPSQVQLVPRNPERQIDGAAKQSREGNRAAANDRAVDQSPQQNAEGNGATEPSPARQNCKPTEATSDHPTAALPAQHGKNELQPAAADACPATHPPAQAEFQPSATAAEAPARSRADAARENGRKSRGPVTPEGKAPSSQNALKHGLSSRRIVTGEEDEREWLEFQAECRQTLEPVGAIEIGYADEFAASRWRLQRCLGIETSIFDQQFAMQKIYRAKECATMDGIDKTGMAFKSAKDDLTALGRYETRIRRSGERALSNLQKLQSIRKNEPGSGADSRCGADALVCEPAPQPVQPSASSASVPRNEPSAPSAGDAPGVAARACPRTERPEAERTQATGHNPVVRLPSAFGRNEPGDCAPASHRLHATSYNPELRGQSPQCT